MDRGQRYVRSARASVLIVSLALIPGVSAQSPIITTVAGPPPPTNGTAAVTQAIDAPRTITALPGGGFLLAGEGQNRIYQVAADGTLTTVAGTGGDGFGGDGMPATAARLASPWSTAIDAAGNIFIADTRNNRIRKVTPQGVISTFAGDGFPSFHGDGGLATAARLNGPSGVAVDAAGNVFIADTHNFRVRKVNPQGIISTFAGTGAAAVPSDPVGDGGPATNAIVQGPRGLAIDSAGNVFIADVQNYRIRKVAPNGIITTVAGTGFSGFGGDDGPAIAAQLSFPTGVAVDGTGTLFIADAANARVRKVTPQGIISTVAGTGGTAFDGDGGPATMAAMGPEGVAVDAAGELLIADTFNHRIRKVNALGIISTIAGVSLAGFGGDGELATSARVNEPSGAVLDANQNLFIADTSNHRIRKVSPVGVITTVAGNGTPGFSGDNGPATAAQLNGPFGVAVKSDGTLYITDTLNNRVRKVAPDGTITTIAGDGTFGFGGDEGPATAAKFRWPVGIVVDASGVVIIGDSNNHRIRKIRSDGSITTVAGTGTSGNGGIGGPATSAQLSYPQHLAIDASGRLLIADAQNHSIRRVDANGIISNVAGIGFPGFGGDGGPATAARFTVATGVATDAAGNIYIADRSNHRIRRVNPAGTISSIAGGSGFPGFGTDGIPAPLARVNSPFGVAVDAAGNVFVADSWNHRVRKIIFSPFTDDPLISGSTVIKAIHLTELRTRTNALRTARGLAPIQWSDSTLAPAVTMIKADHILEIRSALVQVYQSAGMSPPSFTDATLNPSSMPVKAVHITELRSAIRALE